MNMLYPSDPSELLQRLIESEQQNATLRQANELLRMRVSQLQEQIGSQQQTSYATNKIFLNENKA
jgi:hypothetical protein